LTVEELIEALRGYPKDLEVRFYTGEFGYDPIEELRLVEQGHGIWVGLE
jgi:hypothetical protein